MPTVIGLPVIKKKKVPVVLRLVGLSLSSIKERALELYTVELNVNTSSVSTGDNRLVFTLVYHWVATEETSQRV